MTVEYYRISDYCSLEGIPGIFTKNHPPSIEGDCAHLIPPLKIPRISTVFWDSKYDNATFIGYFGRPNKKITEPRQIWTTIIPFDTNQKTRTEILRRLDCGAYISFIIHPDIMDIERRARFEDDVQFWQNNINTPSPALFGLE